MATEMIKKDDSMVVRTEVAGFDPDEVEVAVEDGMLTISGRHEESSEEERDGHTRRERRSRSFTQSVSVPASVAADDVETSRDGDVIEVRVPLAELSEGE